MRIDGRADDQLRKTVIKPGVLAFADGSALIEMGNTHVLCAVSVEDRVPNYLKGANKGWVTAEYGMLPRSTQQRTPREAREGKQSGRTLEIQRLIGRSLRAVTRLDVLGERTFTIDCDVIQADGGTRTAAITGSYVALYQAFHKLMKRGTLPAIPLRCAVAAVSVGIVDGEELLDLCYEEDYRAQADCNVVMTSDGQFVEVQATAEGEPFSRQRLDALLQRASAGLTQLFALQEQAIRSFT